MMLHTDHGHLSARAGDAVLDSMVCSAPDCPVRHTVAGDGFRQGNAAIRYRSAFAMLAAWAFQRRTAPAGAPAGAASGIL